MSDEAEAERTKIGQGVVLTDDDIRAYSMDGFGLGMNPDDFKVPRIPD